jgi:trimethylamine--corrinoid protein Co-methyltransferase
LLFVFWLLLPRKNQMQKDLTLSTPATLLTLVQIEQIHGASLRILEEVGLEITNPKIRKIFTRHGGMVASGVDRIKIPEKVITETIAVMPSRFTFHGRDPQFDCTLPDDGPVFAQAGTAPDVLDLETGAVRRSTSTDVAVMARLVNELPGIDICTCAILANDATTGYGNLGKLYPALKNCLKPVRIGGVREIEDIRKILELGAIIAGSKEAFEERPFITLHCCPLISPLKMDHESTEMFIFLAENRVPMHFSLLPNAGLTAPLSLIGTVAQTNAEFLAVNALLQMVCPETPVIYSTLPTIADLRTGAYVPGAVETTIMFMGCNQMARFYNVPCGGCIGQTNAKIVDAQAGFEKAIGAMGGALGGMDLLHTAGLVDALMAFDCRMLVVDNEIAMMIKRLLRGFENAETELCSTIETIKEVGPGGNFLEHPHTLERLRSTSYFPILADRSMRQKWEENGSLDTSARALSVIRKILATDNPAEFSSAVDSKIRSRFIDMVAGNAIVPKSW